MKNSLQNVRIYLDDMFKNGCEPKKGETVYREFSRVTTDTYKMVSHGIEITIDKASPYGGKIDDKTWHGTKGKWQRLWTDKCFILRNITLKSKK